SSARLKRISARLAPRDPTEHCPRHQTGTAGIVEIEEPANQLAGGVEPWNRHVLDIEHMPQRVDLQAAERERDPTSYRIGFEGRLLDRIRPVRLVDRQAYGALAVFDVGIEFDVTSNGGVVLPECLHESGGIDVLHPVRKLFEAVRTHLGCA